MLTIKNLFYQYDTDFKIEDVSFSLDRGETLAIVGPSGSGKTTLLKIILGAYQQNSGSIFLEKDDISHWDIEKRNIGYCPQDQLLFPHLNVYDNIAIGLKAKKLKDKIINDTVTKLVLKGEMQGFLERKPNQLSGGQKQRVSILRALAPGPRVLLLDEPFHNLDAQIKHQIVTYIKKLQSETNVTIIFVTHDVSEAKILADKILILIDGKMRQFGTPKELIFSPSSFDVASALGLPNIFKILDFNQDSNNVTVSFGEINLGMVKYSNQESLFIDPTCLEISEKSDDTLNTFQGIISSSMIDIGSQKQIYFLEPKRNLSMNDTIQDKNATLQITGGLGVSDFVKNKRYFFKINTDGLKLF